MRRAVPCLLALLAGGLPAAEYETLEVITYVERIAVGDHEPVERRRTGRLVVELPWLEPLPMLPVPPPGFSRTEEAGSLGIDGTELAVTRERWVPIAAVRNRSMVPFAEAVFYRRPDHPLPDMVLGMINRSLYLPAGSLRVEYRPPEERPADAPPSITFTGEDDGSASWTLTDGRELSARRFRFRYQGPPSDSVGVILTADLPGGVCRIEVDQPKTERAPKGSYELRVEAVGELPPARHLAIYPEAKVAYARPQTFAELEDPGEGWTFGYENPQRISLRLAPADLDGQPALAWWRANCPRLIAALPPAERPRASGFCGFAQNDPIYGWVDGAGVLTGWFSHGPRGFRVRIEGYHRLDPTAMRHLFLGLRHEMLPLPPAPPAEGSATPPTP